MRRHPRPARQDKHFPQSGTTSCIFAELITNGTTTLTKQIESLLKLNKEQAFAQVYGKTFTCRTFIKVDTFPAFAYRGPLPASRQCSPASQDRYTLTSMVTVSIE